MKTRRILLLARLRALPGRLQERQGKPGTARTRAPLSGRSHLRARRRARPVRIRTGMRPPRRPDAGKRDARQAAIRVRRLVGLADHRSAVRFRAGRAPASTRRRRRTGACRSWNPAKNSPRRRRRQRSRPQPEPSDRRIARIVLNKQLTGGSSHQSPGRRRTGSWSSSNRATRGAKWWPSRATSRSPWSIPQRAGPQARFARWDFAANEAFEQFHRSGLSAAATSSSCPGPKHAPQNKKLDLFVRYVTPDGRKLMSEMTISVDPPAGNGRRSAGGTGRAGGRSAAPTPIATAQAVGRRLLSRSRPDRGSRDSEAPRFRRRLRRRRTRQPRCRRSSRRRRSKPTKRTIRPTAAARLRPQLLAGRTTDRPELGAPIAEHRGESLGIR